MEEFTVRGEIGVEKEVNKVKGHRATSAVGSAVGPRCRAVWPYGVPRAGIMSAVSPV